MNVVIEECDPGDLIQFGEPVEHSGLGLVLKKERAFVTVLISPSALWLSTRSLQVETGQFVTLVWKHAI